MRASTERNGPPPNVEHAREKRLYRDVLKRPFDLLLASCLLVVLFLPLVAIVLAIVATERQRPFFCQERIGQDGRRFKIIKLRTMVDDAERHGTVTVKNDPRLTRLGAVLRRYRIDEWPQLLNVLKGDMSFVGPRPDVPGYADRLTGEERIVLRMRPGITGPASLAYADEAALLARVANPQEYNDRVIYPHKVRLNLEYWRKASFLGDMRILLQTLGVLPNGYKNDVSLLHK